MFYDKRELQILDLFLNDVSGTNKIKINSYICVIDISFFYFLL